MFNSAIILLCSLDNDKAVLMVLLDVPAAFDTVDRDILLDRLESRFGIRDMVKSWFSTYLGGRVTEVSIDGDFSDDHVLRYSLPQGSIIGPRGLILYTSPVGNIMRAFDFSDLSTPMLMIHNCMPSLIPDLGVVVGVCSPGCLLVLVSLMSG